MLRISSNMNISKRTTMRLMLSLFLCIVVSFSFFGEKIPMNDGAGWDGVLYREMIMSFSDDMADGGYSSYYTQRILPWAIGHYAFRLFDISFTNQNAINFALICNGIAIVLMIICFFKIVDFYKLKWKTEVISFSLFFFIHSTLKYIGYNTLQWDEIGLMIQMWIFYLYLKENRIGMFLLAFIGAFVESALVPITCVMLILPRKNVPIRETPYDGKLNKFFEYCKYALCTLPILSFLYLIRITLKRQWNFNALIPFHYFNLPMWSIIVGVIFLMVYIYVIIRPLHLDVSKMFRDCLAQFKHVDIYIAIILYLAVHFVVNILANPDALHVVSRMDFVRRILWHPLTFPFKFIECAFLYYGLLVPIIIVTYNKMIRSFSDLQNGYVMLFVLAYTLTFITQDESRFVINMFPMLVFIVAQLLDKWEIKNIVVLGVAILNILFSRVWFPINSPALEQNLLGDLTYGPGQRLMYHTGPWQGIHMYVCMSVITVVVIMIVYYVIYKTKWVRNVSKGLKIT